MEWQAGAQGRAVVLDPTGCLDHDESGPPTARPPTGRSGNWRSNAFSPARRNACPLLDKLGEGRGVVVLPARRDPHAHAAGSTQCAWYMTSCWLLAAG